MQRPAGVQPTINSSEEERREGGQCRVIFRGLFGGGGVFFYFSLLLKRVQEIDQLSTATLHTPVTNTVQSGAAGIRGYGLTAELNTHHTLASLAGVRHVFSNTARTVYYSSLFFRLSFISYLRQQFKKQDASPGNRVKTKTHKSVKHKVEMTSGDKMEENKDTRRGAEKKIAYRVDTKTLNDKETHRKHRTAEMTSHSQSLPRCRNRDGDVTFDSTTPSCRKHSRSLKKHVCFSSLRRQTSNIQLDAPLMIIRK